MYTYFYSTIKYNNNNNSLIPAVAWMLAVGEGELLTLSSTVSRGLTANSGCDGLLGVFRSHVVTSHMCPPVFLETVSATSVTQKTG